MKLRKVEGSLAAPNFFLDHDSGIYYVKRMLKGEVKWKSTRQTNPAKAARRYREIMGAMDDSKGGWEEKDVPTLAEWWTDTYRVTKTKSENTWRVQDSVMKPILAQLGRKNLNELTPSLIERYFNWRRRKYEDSTVDHELRVLHSVLEAAVDDDLLDKHPMRKLKQVRPEGRTRVVTEDEERQLLEVLKPQDRPWFTLLLGTGIRIAELAGQRIKRKWVTKGLYVEDVDLPGRKITVIGKGQKTREVPLLSDVVVDILTQRLNDVPKGKLWTGGPDLFQRHMLEAGERAGIEGVTPHVLRHTFGTRYLQGGGDIYILSKILGHTSVKVTEKVYAHLKTEDTRKLSEHVDLKLRSGT